MALPVLLFLSILLATFLLVVAMTRPSPQEKVDRTSGWHRSAKRRTRAALLPRPGNCSRRRAEAGLDGWTKSWNLTHSRRRSEKRILQAGSSTNVATLMVSSLGLFFGGYVVAWLFAPMVLVDIAAGAGLGLLPFGILSFKRTRRISAFNAVLAESIDMLARALRAGHSVVGAMEMLADECTGTGRPRNSERSLNSRTSACRCATR